MKCDKCNKEMQEEVLFTSVTYTCNCDSGWNTVTDMKRLLMMEDFPLKMKYKDEEDGPEIIIFVNDAEYFDRCPPKRKFKILYKYPDGYVGYAQMTGNEYLIVNKGANNE